MVGVLTIYRTSVGKKVIMAVTGLMLVGFIVFHMYGNLKMFQGAEVFNAYAHGLREVGYPIFGKTHLLWVARIGLIGAFGLHIWSAIELSRKNLQGRKEKYEMHEKVQANYAALTMRWGAVVIFFFLLYHLMHFTIGVPGVHPDFSREDAYHNVIRGFQSVPASIVYIVAVLALGFHLYHGSWSMFQTLGLNNKNYTIPLRAFGLGLALVVTLGFMSVPISVMLGVVQ